MSNEKQVPTENFQAEHDKTYRVLGGKGGVDTSDYTGSVGTGKGGAPIIGEQYRTDKFAAIDAQSVGTGGGYTPTGGEAPKRENILKKDRL